MGVGEEVAVVRGAVQRLPSPEALEKLGRLQQQQQQLLGRQQVREGGEVRMGYLGRGIVYYLLMGLWGLFVVLVFYVCV